MERLLTKAELLLWKCRKELSFGKLDELKKRCSKERDDVLRVEGSIFSKLRRDYEEKLAEEKEEAVRANLELELAEKEIAEMEEQISSLEMKMKGVSSIYNTEEMSDAEKELYDWCAFAEQAYEVIALTNRCLEKGWAERMRSYSNPGNLKNCVAFQENVEELYRIMDGFLSMVGRVRYLPGIRDKNNALLQRSSRTTYYGGKTLVFLRKGRDAVQIDLHELDFRNLWGGWAAGDALERKLKEIEILEQLFSGIIKEYIILGEELLKKVRLNCFHSAQKDIFGFEKKNENKILYTEWKNGR